MGLAYLPGALPCFEAFGNLPTHLVLEDGLVEGKPAAEVLDMIIIPGGSLVESQSIKSGVMREILKMADSGRFVLGICSGFQILSQGTDIGRLSSTPIMRDGLGLVDAEFSPLVCTDQIQATITDTSFLTSAVGEQVNGFHCHTYGKIVPHKKAKPILTSHTKRLNYRSNPQDLISGIANKEGNVVGIITHGLLDQNSLIIEGIAKSLDINAQELTKIRVANAKLLSKIKSEIGVQTGIHAKPPQIAASKKGVLMVTALGSGSGKTFIVAGLSGALKKLGVNVGVVKVGGDIRDLVPSLYLIKEPIRCYSSVRVGRSGWKDAVEAVNEAAKDYELLLIEGAMSAFTGMLNENVLRPSSTAEVAAVLGVPTVVVVGCNNEGIEGALVSALNYVKLLKSLGVEIVGVILNKVRTSYLTDQIKKVMEQALANAGVKLLGIVPRIDVEGRGAIPEIEIHYDEFGAKAIQTIETSVDLNGIIHAAGPVAKKNLDYEAFVKNFQETLTTDYSAKPKGDKEACL
ncbi:MAG: AAA family ATPase [Candidatus Bathyarchaeota archaeon]|nr:AAA family ATPase [Candidatus Bathyarchaeota archaeon]